MSTPEVPSRPFGRRALLTRGGLLAAGVVAVGVATAPSSASAVSRPLTASALGALRGRSIAVSGEGWRGVARVAAVTGTNGGRARERAFQLILVGDRTLPAGGALLRIEHRAIGSHALFVSPDRDRRRWVAVVQDLADTEPAPGGGPHG